MNGYSLSDFVSDEGDVSTLAYNFRALRGSSQGLASGSGGCGHNLS